MFAQVPAFFSLPPLKQFRLLGLISVLLMLLHAPVVMAQGLVMVLVPQVQGILGENGWYVSDILVSWPVPADAFDIVGCQDTLIDYDTAGVLLTCEFSIPTAHGATEVEFKRDATPPQPSLNVPTAEALLLPEGAVQPLVATYDPGVEVSPVEFFVDTDEDGLFDDAPIFEAIDGLAEDERNPDYIVWRFVDEAGNETILTTEVIVENVAPNLAPEGTAGHLGNTATLLFSLFDPGVLDTHSAEIDWGDEAVTAGAVVESQGSGTISGAHVYEKRGDYTVVVSATDKDGDVDTAVMNISVGESPRADVALGAVFGEPGADWITRLNGVVPLLLTSVGSQTQALLSPDPGGCLGLMSWGSLTGELNQVGSVIFCLADASVNEQAFNFWSDQGGGINPDLVIPLAPLANGQLGPHSWTNPEPVNARLFTQGCGESQFRRYGDLLLEAGDLSLTTWTDDLGRPEIDISARLVRLEPNPDTWEDYRAACETADRLPEAPLGGTAVDLGGGTFYLAPDPDTSFGQFVLIDEQVSALAFDRRLAIDEADNLNQVLGKFIEWWREVTGDQALHQLYKFVGDVEKLVGKGELNAVDGDTLIDPALSLAKLIDSAREAPPPAPRLSSSCDGEAGPCEDTLTSCALMGGIVEFYVDADAFVAGADGSRARPFRTLTEALEQTAHRSACGVRLRVAAGTYGENLNISRHTYIYGNEANVFIQGSISHTGPYLLHLERLNMEWRPGSGGAAIVADHPCARVILENVHISGYQGYGIRQRGGSLYLRSSSVDDTVALPEDISQGSGIYVTCGTQARLIEVDLSDNESSGLQIADEGTEVQAYLLNVVGTGIHPILAQYLDEECPPLPHFGLQVGCVLTAGTGAIYVRDGGVLEANRFLVEDSLNIGVHVASGGEVLLEQGTIRLTEPVLPDRGIAINITASAGGHVRLHNFAVERSHTGLLILSDGEIDAHSGLVSGHSFGASVPGHSYDLRRLTNDVRWEDNTVNIADNASLELGIPPPLSPSAARPTMRQSVT